MTLYEELKGIDQSRLNVEAAMYNLIGQDLEIYRAIKNVENANKGKDFEELIPQIKDELYKIREESNQQPQPSLFLDLQKNAMQKYEDNPVFRDAIRGRMTITESLEDLSHYNRGIRVILPRRKNTILNMRIDELGELINKPTYLKHNGLFAMDNFVNGTLYGAAGGAAVMYITTALLLPTMLTNPHSPESMHFIKNAKEFFPLIGVAMAPIYGLMISKYRSSESIPARKEEAKYLDTKIKEFYK